MKLYKFRNSVLESFETLLTSFVVLMVVYVTVAFPVEVSGSSMFPNLETGDRLLVEKLTKFIDGYQRGDIVVLHPPENDYIDYVKRIVAVPGDTVKILNCQILITRNNTKFQLDESVYLPKNVCTSGGKSLQEGRVYTLQSNQYVVLGDNRVNSADSRVFGLITEDRIQGKVVARMWPFDRVKLY